MGSIDWLHTTISYGVVKPDGAVLLYKHVTTARMQATLLAKKKKKRMQATRSSRSALPYWAEGGFTSVVVHAPDGHIFSHDTDVPPVKDWQTFAIKGRKFGVKQYNASNAFSIGACTYIPFSIFVRVHTCLTL